MGYGANIERARRRAGLTQSELAERIGRDQGTVSGYENDRFRPDVDVVVSIAAATGATTDDLLRGEPAGVATADDRSILEIIRALGLAKDEVIRRLYSAPAAPAAADAIKVGPPQSAPRPGSPTQGARTA